MKLGQHYRTLGLRRGASAPNVKAAYRKLVRQYHPDINPDEAAIEQFIKINDAYTALSEALEDSAQKTVTPAVERKDASDHIATANGQTRLDGRLVSLMQTLEKMGLGNFGGLENGSSETASADKSMPAPSYPTPTYIVEQPAVSANATTQVDTQLENSINSQDSTQTIEPTFSGTQAELPSQSAARPLSAQETTLKQEAYEQLKGLLKQQKFPRAIALVEGLAHRMPNDSEIIQWQAIVYQRWGRKLIDNGQSQKARIYLKKALRTDPHNPSLWREINRDFWQLANL